MRVRAPADALPRSMPPNVRRPSTLIPAPSSMSLPEAIKLWAMLPNTVKIRSSSGRRDMAKRKPGKKDVVVGVAASGRTPYTIGALEHA